MSREETELRNSINRIITSTSRKKLIATGPGTGKTTLLKLILKEDDGEKENRIVLTFINNLKNDLEEHLSCYANVFTLHAFCIGLLHKNTSLRSGLLSQFRCQPGLANLIRKDWKYIRGSSPPHFVRDMRNIYETDSFEFYIKRGNYYNAVDFDDAVYRVYRNAKDKWDELGEYVLVLVDEYQDFNRLEATIIELLGRQSRIVIVGDDDQALYSQLRGSSWDYIRMLYHNKEYDVFELPFCLRCPKVIVGAVNDIITKAHELGKLQGRIPKTYKYFPPIKREDSNRYPSICLVKTSVQKQNANYFGRYIAHSISKIPTEEVEEAKASGYPSALVIAANPYRSQITAYLEANGFQIKTKRDSEERLDRSIGLELLKSIPDSNLGWRIILANEDDQFVVGIIRASANGKPLSKCITSDYKERLLAEVDEWAQESKDDKQQNRNKEDSEHKSIMVTSFEGAKGLSAQHVFIAGLHNGDMPRDPNDIQDMEICRFLVGLTRTRKQCNLIHTGRFAGQRKLKSAFISWIHPDRFEVTNVNAQYWNI